MPSNVISWIFAYAWAIQRESLETILQIAGRDDKIEALKSSKFDGFEKGSQALVADVGEYLEGSYRATVRNGNAVIPVVGPIFPRANLFTMVSGATSVEMMAKDFSVAMEDPSVHTIVFNIDSPGGQMVGIEEFAQTIRDSSGKRVVAYIYGLGASAAYWLASAADDVVVAPTAIVGSIGVILPIQDTRKRDEKKGIRNVNFVSSVSPRKAMDFDSEKDISETQAFVDTLGNLFVESVSRFRGVSVEHVKTKFGQGGVVVGEEAVERGMVDGVGNLESILNNKQNTQSTEGVNMTLEELKAKHPDLYAEAVGIGKAEALTAAKTEASASVDEKVKLAKEESAKAERDRIQSIEAISIPGAEKIIAEQKYNPSATAESVAVAIVQAQKEKAKKQGNAVASDAEALGAQAAALGGQSAEEASAEEEASVVAAMIEGANAI